MLFVLRIKNITLKALAYAKKYWYIAAGVLATIIFGALTLGKRSLTISSVFSEIEDAHNQEIDKINSIRAAADDARLANEEAKQKALLDASKQHLADQAKIEAKREAIVEKMIQEQGDNPEKVAESLAKSLNASIVIVR